MFNFKKLIKNILLERKGLSLLEITISIIVILIIFSMATPIYFKHIAKMKYITSVREIQSGIKVSRNIAKENNTESGVIIDIPNETIYFSEDYWRATDNPSGTVTSHTNDTITDTSQVWPDNKWVGSGILILGTASSPKTRLFLIESNISNTITSTGNFGTVNDGDSYLIIPLTKREYKSGIDIKEIQTLVSTITTRTSITFKNDGTAYDNLNNCRDFCIHLESKGIAPVVQETIKIVGNTGTVYKLQGFAAP